MGRSKSKADGPSVSRYVDMWAFTSMHPVNIDLLQQLKSADDRQFGTNMDVCGTVSEKRSKKSGWDKTHMFGIRSDVWGLDAQHRRLVIKMFKTTGERIRWVGTLEEITTREVHNSIGSRRAVLSLAGLLPGYEYMVMVQQNHRTFRIPAVFTFGFHEEDQDRMRYVSINRKWISIGADFTLESGGRKIGDIDGQLIGLGYNAYVHVNEPSLAGNRHFVDLITLFTATVGYHRAMRKSIRRRVRAAHSGGEIPHDVEDEEFWLLRNPRRVAA